MTNTGATAVYARDMHAAQGYKITPAHRVELTAQAEAVRSICGTEARQDISVPVRDCHAPHALIGHLTYRGL